MQSTPESLVEALVRDPQKPVRLIDVMPVKERERLLTTIAEIFAWVTESDAGSLDKVEWIMAMEEELGFEIPDELAARVDAFAIVIKTVRIVPMFKSGGVVLIQ
jgi:acyl carrier protein